MSEPDPINFRPRWSEGLSDEAMRELEQEPCIGKDVPASQPHGQEIHLAARNHTLPNGWTLADYIHAMSIEGPLAGEWKDKPHRLVYDLVKEVLRLKEKAGE